MLSLGGERIVDDEELAAGLDRLKRDIDHLTLKLESFATAAQSTNTVFLGLVHSVDTTLRSAIAMIDNDDVAGARSLLETHREILQKIVGGGQAN